jgi:hypothetical protein
MRRGARGQRKRRLYGAVEWRRGSAAVWKRLCMQRHHQEVPVALRDRRGLSRAVHVHRGRCVQVAKRRGVLRSLHVRERLLRGRVLLRFGVLRRLRRVQYDGRKLHTGGNRKSRDGPFLQSVRVRWRRGVPSELHFRRELRPRVLLLGQRRLRGAEGTRSDVQRLDERRLQGQRLSCVCRRCRPLRGRVLLQLSLWRRVRCV